MRLPLDLMYSPASFVTEDVQFCIPTDFVETSISAAKLQQLDQLLPPDSIREVEQEDYDSGDALDEDHWE
jgi:hypothetical protein